MLAVSARFPDKSYNRVPIILVPGSFATSLVWTYWQEALANLGWVSYAIDLRGHGSSSSMDLSSTTMSDYVSDIRCVVENLDRPPIMMGWSMGGLISMLYATTYDTAACVGLEPTTPAKTTNPEFRIRGGEYPPIIPGMTDRPIDDQSQLPDLDFEERQMALDAVSKESRYANGERRAGVVITSLPSPLLVFTGKDDVSKSNDDFLADWLNAEEHVLEGVSHWGLVLNRRAISITAPLVSTWLLKNISQ